MSQKKYLLKAESRVIYSWNYIVPKNEETFESEILSWGFPAALQVLG